MVWRFIVWVWWVGEFVGFDELVAGFRGVVCFGCVLGAVGFWGIGGWLGLISCIWVCFRCFLRSLDFCGVGII